MFISGKERIKTPRAGPAETNHQQHDEVQNFRQVQRVANHVEPVDGFVHTYPLLAFAPDGNREDSHHPERGELGQETKRDGNPAQEFHPGHEPLVEPDEGDFAVLQRFNKSPVPDLVKELEIPAHDEEDADRNAVDEQGDIGLGHPVDDVVQQVHVDSL